jgi:hypothetical protein
MTTFKFQDLYSCPVIHLTDSNKQFVFEKEIVEFLYNSNGYRTHEFDNVSTHIVVSGCSLTEGHGLHQHQTWASKYEKALGTTVYNLAKGGSSAEFVSQTLQNWIYTYNPLLVVAQWPNPFRSLTWKNSTAVFNLNSNFDEIYCIKLKNGIENFYHTWCNSIVTLNHLCKFKKIPVINMCLESVEVVSPSLEILNRFNIKLHYDMKVPEHTWFFDSAALDQLHHSEWCNDKWTERLLTITKDML